MRYIKKKINSPARSLLIGWRQQRINAKQDLLYVNFDYKEDLNNILREEQGAICCYCQQRIKHHEGDNNGGSHNEHYVPQKGKHGSVELQLEYINLFACCNYSRGREEKNQHCGEAKSKELLGDFFKKLNCSTFF